MSLAVRPYAPADLEPLRELIARGDLASHFDALQGPHGLEHALSDPFLAPGGVAIAELDGALAGFAMAYVLPGEPRPWAALRVGVLESRRRHGAGRALIAWAERIACEQTARPGVDTLTLQAWMPNPAAEAFAARLGYAHARWFWQMERPRSLAPAPPAWPAGVTPRTFDGSDAMVVDFTTAYNNAFARHYRFVRASVADIRARVEQPGFRADGLGIAYRGGRPVGFCRTERFEARGEVAVLGTVPEARGIGLGRALLRWGVAWLTANTGTPVTLLVDGENETALRLYRDEGFAVARTRGVYARPAGGR